MNPHEKEAVALALRKLNAEAIAAETLAEKAMIERDTAKLAHRHVEILLQKALAT